MIINRSATLPPLPEPLEKKHKKQWTLSGASSPFYDVYKIRQRIEATHQNKAFISTQRARQLHSDLVPLQEKKKPFTMILETTNS